MKKIFIALSMLVFIASCNTDPCKDVSCLNGGTCVTGDCNCPLGYEGPTCSTEMRAKFLSSNYSVTEVATVSGSFGPYNASITSSSTDAKKIFLNNFGDFNANITIVADISSTNAITIAAQTVSGYTINGSGTINGNTLTINYSVSASGGGSETSVATWQKQ